MTIKRQREHWAQPGSIRYDYRHKDGGLWNVDRFSDSTVSLWTINAWGNTYTQDITRADFDRQFTRHDKPSMYDQMAKAKRTA